MNTIVKIGLVARISILLLILLSLSGMAAIVLADGDPIIHKPNRFSGNVTLNNVAAPVGTVINAFIDGALRGSVVVESPGEYEYLSVSGSAWDDGKNVTFTVCGANAEPNSTWIVWMGPARTHNLDAEDNIAPAVTDANANPSSIVAGGVEMTQLNVTVIDGCRCTVGPVTVNLSAIGGGAAQVMTCIEGTDVYTVTVTAAEGTAGEHCLQVNASDVFGNCNTSVCIELNITSEDTHTISLDAGWNMVSIPVIPADASVDAIFGDNITIPVYGYNGGYEMVTSLEPKKGYWVLANSPVDISISGAVPSDLGVTVVPGWNMIGPVSSNVQVSSFTGIIPPVYGYAAGYDMPTTLEQTEGYWVLASAETTLTV